jgi:phosphoribosylglycinamide formyltransferase-1
MKRIAVFGYDFPHWKTQTGLFNMLADGFRPDLVLLAPWKKLNIGRSKIRIAPHEEPLIHPSRWSLQFKLPVWQCDHNSDLCCSLLLEHGIDVGIVLGARILPRFIIESCNYGIVNFHPGKLPDNRGLDNIKWAILDDIQLGVTVHWIDQYVDAGRRIFYQPIVVYNDDTLMDIHIRTRTVEQKLLSSFLWHFSDGHKFPKDCPEIGRSVPKRVAVPWEKESNLLSAFEQYKERYAQPKE